MPASETLHQIFLSQCCRRLIKALFNVRIQNMDSCRETISKFNFNKNPQFCKKKIFLISNFLFLNACIELFFLYHGHQTVN